MTDQHYEEAERLRAMGLDVKAVGEILSERSDGTSSGDAGLTIPPPFDLARLADYPYPPLPAGLYFGLDEAIYHGTPALSYTGIKRLASSPMLYWATTAWLNADFEPPEEKDHFNLGHGYDCRIFDGKEAFAERFALKPDKADYPGVLVTGDDIKERLADLGLKPKGASKAGWFEQLVEFEPDAQLWQNIVTAWEAENEGKLAITPVQYARIEIAARMIENDEEMATIVRDGHSQASLFWNCPKTGVPMKARPDKLMMRAIVDMKSLNNQRGRSIERAIVFEIADRKYNIQPSVYLEGAEIVRKLIREQGISVIHSCDLGDGTADLDADALDRKRTEWAQKWASNIAPDEWLWIFQQTGVAPVTRLVHYPRGGTTKMITDEIVSRMKRRYRQCSEEYGTLPWLDLAPRIDLADEDIPRFATDI